MTVRGESARGPTKSQVNKAGKIIRRFVRKETLTMEDLHSLEVAVEVLQEHRAAHQYPLTKATMGLRSAVSTEHCEIEVSQRLKRLPTIVQKLFREPTLQLGNMQDIAGCRAVLGNVEELRRVQRRVQRNRKVGDDRVSDYIAVPRSSGYRGVHVVVEYDDRKVEVQLRTRVMHEWAIAVETIGARLSNDVKGGEGPPQVLAWFRAISEAMAIEETGRDADPALVSEISRLRNEAAPWLQGAP